MYFTKQRVVYIINFMPFWHKPPCRSYPRIGLMDSTVPIEALVVAGEE
ncbi:MAG: hypothetical protein J5644_08210 [Bacteroidales bacterium]|nr:hypothetical protein [Bacteroidales bacterium]